MRCFIVAFNFAIEFFEWLEGRLLEKTQLLLRNSQDSINISTIYIPPASTISTALLDNIKKTVDNIIITGDPNAKHIDFNCTKSYKWGLALKKALYNTDLFIADNIKPTHRDGRTNVI